MTERPPELAADRRVTIRRFLLVAASCLLGIFGWFLLDDSASAEVAPGVIAQVGGKAITQDEIRRVLAPELAALERQRQQLWQKAIETRIDELLIDKAALAQGLSSELFLARELGADPADHARRRAELLERLRRETRISLYPG